ncbi:MAG: hypothetical protein KAG28_08225 [Cocleimonas sp.]|nr:hypothetical protein [Cocleimonas sp.]
MSKEYKFHGQGRELIIGKTRLSRRDNIVIYLSGNFSRLQLDDLGSTTYTLQILPEKGKTVNIKRLLLNDCNNVHINGHDRINVKGTAKEVNTRTEQAMVRVKGKNCTIEGLHIYSKRDTSEWTPTYWKANARNGIVLSGYRCIARRNTIFNVRNGIEIKCPHGKAAFNTIRHFFEDGIRALADHVIVDNNSIAIAQDSGSDHIHCDAIQMWNAKGKPSEGVLNGLAIINNHIWNRSDYPGSRLMQGIGCFDGVVRNSSVTGNIVNTDHEHGITLGVAKNTLIQENIVFSTRPEVRKSWIKIGTNKQTTERSRDNSLAFNSSESYIYFSMTVRENISNIILTEKQVAYLRDLEWDRAVA